MSWSEIQRTLFYKGICENPPFGDASSANTEAIRDLINSAHKRFQKKITLSDVNNELKKEYNLPPQVTVNDTDNKNDEPPATNLAFGSSKAEIVQERSTSPKSDIKTEEEGENAAQIEHKAGNRRNTRKPQQSENSSSNRAKSMSLSPRPRTRRQRALRDSVDVSDAEDAATNSEKDKEHSEEPKDDLKECTSIQSPAETPATRSGKAAQEKVKEEEEVSENDNSANELNDTGSSDGSSDVDDGEEKHDNEEASDNESPEREASAAPAEESDTEKLRGRRASRAARPSMRRDSLSPMRRTRSTAQRSKTPDSSTSMARSARPNMKRVRETEEQGEVSDSESEDLPPSKRRAKRRQANADANSTSTAKRANSRKRAETVSEEEETIFKKDDPKARPTRKRTPKSYTRGSSSRGRGGSSLKR